MRAERDITHAERSVFAGLGMIGMAGLSAFQGANVPEYRPMAGIGGRELQDGIENSGIVPGPITFPRRACVKH